jgi:hypothetical protein
MFRDKYNGVGAIKLIAPKGQEARVFTLAFFVS